MKKHENTYRRGAVVKGVEHVSTIVFQHLSGAVSSPAGSVGRDLNLQKLNCVVNVCPVHAVDLNSLTLRGLSLDKKCIKKTNTSISSF